MKKKHFLIAILIFVIGLLYGTGFSFIISNGTETLFYCCVQGMFVGLLLSLVYITQFLFYAYCVDKSMIDDVASKILIITENGVALISIVSVTAMYISWYYKYIITFSYIWMHIVNLIVAIAAILKANYDGKLMSIKKGK